MEEGIVKNKFAICGVIILITSIIMSIITISIYFNLSKPQFYKNFIELGNKFLNESKYEEAILEFKKAIHIEPKSIEARIGSGKSYIGLNEVDNAVIEFKEAQNLDIENTKILLEILNILNSVDSEIAYDILQNYINRTQNTIPDNIQQIINNSNDNPDNIIVNYHSGKYINPINIKLKINKFSVGNTFYYTLDGSEPSKDSIKYSGNINIKEDSIVKIIAYNHKGESSEIIILEYFIDYEMMNKIDELIKESEALIKNTKEGTNIGNCIKGSKEKFKYVINSIKESLSKDAITYENAEKMYERLSSALEDFKYNIIEETDKSKLKDIISKAQNIYDKAVEGEKEGQYKVGSKDKLLSVIKECQNIYDDILSKQKDIDNGVYLLNQAINTFESSKVVLFNEQQAISILKLKYTNEIYKSKKEVFRDFILKNEHYVSNKGTINGKRYYDIVFSMTKYLESGEMFYDNHADEYTKANKFGCVYRVYEDGYIEEMEIFN